MGWFTDAIRNVVLFHSNAFPETLSSFESSKGFNFDLLEMFFSFEKEKKIVMETEANVKLCGH